MYMTKHTLVQTYKNPDPNGRPLIDCKKCGERKEHEARGYCGFCYRKYVWKGKKIICNSCGRLRDHSAFGLCGGCHNRIYHYDNTKRYNAKKNYGIDLEKLRKFTKECVVCSFNKIVDLHHLDGDKKNNVDSNLVGLCPNCHKMIHSYNYYEEIKEGLRKRGYDVSRVHPSNFVRKRDVKKNDETRRYAQQT